MIKQATANPIPLRPKDGKFKDAEGRICVLRAEARAMGFTPKTLRVHGTLKKKHPALGTCIGTSRQWFRTPCCNGSEREDELIGYVLSDLQSIKDKREEALAKAAVLDAPDDGPCTTAKAAELLGITPGAVIYRKNAKKLAPKRGAVAHVNGERVRFEQSLLFDRATLTPKIDDSRISLPDAARELGELLTTMHNWRRKSCPPLGTKLSAPLLPGYTNHNHQRDLRTISRDDLNKIKEAKEIAKRGWMFHDGDVYVSPAFVEKYFKLPKGESSTRQVLANCDLRSSIGKTKGLYIATDGKFLNGDYWRLEDVEKHFGKKGPLPRFPQSESATIDTPKQEPPKNAGGRPTEVATWDIYEFCYRKYVTEDRTAPVVMELCNRQFEDTPIGEESTVRMYARRYAKKFNKPKKGQKT